MYLTPQISKVGVLILTGIGVLAAILILLIVLLVRRHLRRTRPQAMTHTLVFTHGHFAGQRFPVKGRIKIGRDAGECTMIFPREVKSVAPLHCVLYHDGNTLLLISSSASYVTYLNGKELPTGKPTPLKIGDTVALGGTLQMFRVEA